jgi:hypothetical protein
MVSGIWRQMERETVRPGRYGAPVPDETADVEQGDRARREARIQAIVWQLTHKPVLVKVRERTFREDVERGLGERLG